MIQFSKERFVAALQDAGFSSQRLQEDYVWARTLEHFPARCPAITMDTVRDAMRFAGALGWVSQAGLGPDDADFQEVIRAAVFDRMGREGIIYFPCLKLTGSASDD